MDPLHGIWTGFAVAVGLVLGSFANVCIARWPEDRSVVTPRSACPSCGTPIAARDNVPVLSWALLRGRCRTCAWPIPVTYPLVEVLGACVAFLVWRRFVPDGVALVPVNVVAWAYYLLFAGALLVGALVDVRHRILPDEVTVYAVPLGVAGAFLLERLGFVDRLAPTLADSVAGAIAGALVLGTVAVVGRILARREVLGWGDVRLLAMIGSFLGFHPALYAVMLLAAILAMVGGLLALLVHRRRTYLPFGPALAASALTWLLYGEHIVPRGAALFQPFPVRDLLRFLLG